MTQQSRPRFTLVATGDAAWDLVDTHFNDGHERHVVGRIWEVDPGECEVTWLRDVPLRRWYSAPQDALEDLVATMPRSTSPIRIPSRPPLATAG